MNLYELSQQDFTKTGPLWLRSDQSPRYTPAPPPSACDYYLPPPNDRKLYVQQSDKEEKEIKQPWILCYLLISKIY